MQTASTSVLMSHSDVGGLIAIRLHGNVIPITFIMTHEYTCTGNIWVNTCSLDKLCK